MKKLHLILVFLFSASFFAQTNKQLVQAGDKKFAEGDFYSAAKFFEEAFITDTNNIDIAYKLGESYRGFNDYKKAVFYYQRSYDYDDDNIYPWSTFWLAFMNKQNGEYEKAAKFFKEFKSYYKNKRAYEYQLANQEEMSCKWALQNQKDSSDLRPFNMGNMVNSTNSEFSPFIYQDTILFSSLRSETMGEDLEIYAEDYKINLYQSEINDILQPSETQLFDFINKYENDHVANGSFSFDYQTFYYSLCKDSGNCIIKAVEKIENKWAEPTIVDGVVNDENFTYTQPKYSIIDGKEVLLFASNQTGTLGNLDIWIGELKKPTKVKSVKNAGKLINSQGNEITPFYDTLNKELYFSSDWHYGFGGFDIFKSVNTDGKFETPENLKLPVNSPANDMYFIWDARKNIAVYTSNRIGSLFQKAPTCCNDLWYVKGYYTPPVIEIDTTEEELIVETEITILPVTLYFHNDEPNPKSWDSTTNLNYLATYESYISLIDDYKKNSIDGMVSNDKKNNDSSLDNFFNNRVHKGVEDLDSLKKIIFRELEAGNKVELTVRGFASPLAKTHYNIPLTGRRISTIVNYFNEVDKGAFKPYLSGNEPALTFTKVKFGEYSADTTISDNLYQQDISVYSVKAALERKIELTQVNIIKPGKKYAAIKFNKNVIDLGYLTPSTEFVKANFKISNTGNDTLNISKLYSFSDNAELELKDETILPNESTDLSVKIPVNDYHGINALKIYLESNALQEKRELTITFHK